MTNTLRVWSNNALSKLLAESKYLVDWWDCYFFAFSGKIWTTWWCPGSWRWRGHPGCPPATRPRPPLSPAPAPPGPDLWSFIHQVVILTAVCHIIFKPGESVLPGDTALPVHVPHLHHHHHHNHHHYQHELTSRTSRRRNLFACTSGCPRPSLDTSILATAPSTRLP